MTYLLFKVSMMVICLGQAYLVVKESIFVCICYVLLAFLRQKVTTCFIVIIREGSSWILLREISH